MTVAQRTANTYGVSGTLDAVEVGATYPYRKPGHDALYLLQVHTYNNSLSGTYQLEVAPPGTTDFTPVCNTDGSVVTWTDQGIVFAFDPAASCDIRFNMTSRASGSVTYSIRAG